MSETDGSANIDRARETDDRFNAASPFRRNDRTFLYKYLNADTAIKVLASGSMLWSSPVKFNDRFDVSPTIGEPVSPAQFSEAAVDQLFQWIDTGEVPADPQLISLVAYVSSLLKSHPRQHVRARLQILSDFTTSAIKLPHDEFNTVYQATRPDFRILCLSDVNDSGPMWHWYGEANTGVVLGFKLIDGLDSALLLAERVVYSDDVPRFAPETLVKVIAEKGKAFDLLRPLLLTKQSAWSYESEYRSISFREPHESPSSTGLLRGFDSSELAKVYLGTDASPQTAARVVAIVGARYPDAEVLRAGLDIQTNRIGFIPL